MAPQVQVIDGNIVINPQSLTVNAAAEKDTGLAEFKRVEENGTRLNSATYSNRAKAEKWNKEDTELFYRAMTQFGTDFSLIARLFPGRTRRQVKRKYLIEDRADPRRVEAAIQNREQDPAMYKNLISVLKAQAAERMESSIDARVSWTAITGRRIQRRRTCRIPRPRTTPRRRRWRKSRHGRREERSARREARGAPQRRNPRRHARESREERRKSKESFTLRFVCTLHRDLVYTVVDCQLVFSFLSLRSPPPWRLPNARWRCRVVRPCERARALRFRSSRL